MDIHTSLGNLWRLSSFESSSVSSIILLNEINRMFMLMFCYRFPNLMPQCKKYDQFHAQNLIASVLSALSVICISIFFNLLHEDILNSDKLESLKETRLMLLFSCQALWLHRRFLLTCWIRYFACGDDDRSLSSNQRNIRTVDIDILIDNELELFRSCTNVPDSDFADYQAQATFAATYMMWLKKVLCFFILVSSLQ